ncbi:hypothetical protein D3C84_418290 [compost metagenome]
MGHFSEQQEDRRPDANRGIRRNQPDGEGAERHDHDSGRQDFLPTILIAQRTEKQTAQRPDQERNREGGQRGNHLHTGISTGEKYLAENIGNKTIDAEIEPLHRVAECSGSDRLAHFRVVDNGDVFQSDRINGFLR